jgi:hypothetical protein
MTIEEVIYYVNSLNYDDTANMLLEHVLTLNKAEASVPAPAEVVAST